MNIRERNAIENTKDMVDTGTDVAHKVIDKAADHAGEMITNTQHAAAEAEASLQEGLRQVREAVPATLAHAASRAEDLARAGIDKARMAGSAVASKASQVGTSTSEYVRQEPAKALLMAAAAGAAATLLISWATRQRTQAPPRP